METKRETTKTLKGKTDMGLEIECTIWGYDDQDCTVSLTIKHEGTNYGIQIDGLDELSKLVEQLRECEVAAQYCL